MKKQQFNSIEKLQTLQILEKKIIFKIIGGITDPNNDEDEDDYEHTATDVAAPTNSTGTSTNSAPRRT